MFSHRPYTSDATTAAVTNVGGASLYVASAPCNKTIRGLVRAGVSQIINHTLSSRTLLARHMTTLRAEWKARANAPTAPPIVYRRYALLRPGQRVLRAADSANKSPRVDSVTSPDVALTATLPANSICRLQVRTWKDDRENTTNYGERVVCTSVSADAVDAVAGSGYVTRIEICQDGGAKIRFIWSDGLFGSGDSPVNFVLQQLSGPSVIADVTVNYSARKRLYTLEVAGLDDAGVYGFRLYAQSAGGTLLNIPNAAPSGLPDLIITGDQSGPAAVTGLAYEER